MLNWCPSLVICLSKPNLREFDDGGRGLSRLCRTRGSLLFSGPKAEISFHSLCQWLTNGEMRADISALDDEFRKWQCFWGEDPMADFGEVHMNEPLLRPSLNEVRKAIRSFPMFIAVGHDDGSHGPGGICPMARLRRSLTLA